MAAFSSPMDFLPPTRHLEFCVTGMLHQKRSLGSDLCFLILSFHGSVRANFSALMRKLSETLDLSQLARSPSLLHFLPSDSPALRIARLIRPASGRVPFGRAAAPDLALSLRVYQHIDMKSPSEPNDQLFEQFQKVSAIGVIPIDSEIQPISELRDLTPWAFLSPPVELAAFDGWSRHR